MKRYYYPPMLLAILISAFLLAGCGGSTTSVEEYDTLINELGFDERDIDRLATPNGRNQIDADSISNFVVGTVVNVIDSTYSKTPIFNLKLLDNESLLDLNAQSASQDDVSTIMTSNKNATSFSYAESLDSKASANFAGLIGLGAAVHADHSKALSNSDGSIYVAMSRGKHGSYFEVLAEDLVAGFDFTPYLIGTELTEEEIKEYVDYKEESAGPGKGAYVYELVFTKNQGYGQIDWSRRNVYGNVQLLSEMERVFGLMLEQYDAFEGDETVQNTLYFNMANLKRKIGHAVQDFYKHVGTHFVSKLNFCNYAYGYGTLQFDEEAGNEEARYGAAVSLGGGIPSKFSAESSTSASYARQSGWASAMKNLTIEAHSRPGGMDLGTFAADIRSMLSDEGAALSVPQLKVPTSPTVEVLDVPELKKKSTAPPDSVFANYDEWKQYQKDLKSNTNLDGSIKDISKEIDEEGLDVLEIEEPPDDTKNSPNLYDRFAEELALLKQKAANDDEVAAQGSNILRIDDMFVSGFETTPYESVIPSLRTSKIVLPDKADRADAYPNGTRLLLVADLFRDLSDYTAFMSNFNVSNIDDTFNTEIQAFYDHLSEKTFDLVMTHMSSGQDVDDELMHTFAVSMFGESDGDGLTDSDLYAYLKDNIDKVNYVKYLLEPKVTRVWRDAPGGYAPFFFRNKSLRFAALHRLIDHYVYSEDEPFTNHCYGHLYELESDLSLQVKDTPNLLDLYDGRSESPLFPIFRYELKNDVKLLFLQLAGRYQLIFAANGIIHPYYRSNWYYTDSIGTIDLYKDTFYFKRQEQGSAERVKYYTNMIPDIGDHTLTPLINYCEGFDVELIDRDHALYFPDRTQSADLWEANRVARLALSSDQTRDCRTSDKITPILPNGMDSYYFKGYELTDIHSILINGYDTGKALGQVVKVEDGSLEDVYAEFFLLLPIDYTKVGAGYGSLLMSAPYGVDDFIGNPTYDAAVVTAVHD